MLPAAMHGKGLVRAAILLLAGAVIAAVAAASESCMTTAICTPLF